jgi:hypothetical protein
MRRILLFLAVTAVALFTLPGDVALAQGTSVRFLPPSKYAALVLASYAETNVDTDLAVGQAATNERRAQGFKIPVTSKVGRVSLWLKATGAPTDNLTVQIQTNSGGVPSGTVVTNGGSNPVAGSSVGASYGWVAFDFPVPPQLTGGAQYHLALGRSGPVDGANYYLWGADQSSPGYGDGAGSVYGGSWQATSPATDHAFQVRPAFTVDVYAKDVRTTTPCSPYSETQPCGLGAYQLKVGFDPAAIQYVSVANGSFLTSTGRLIFLCFNPLGHVPAAGVVTYSCTTTGNPPGGPTPFGPEGSGVLATITFLPLAAGTISLQFQETILADVTGTAISHTAENGSVTLGNYGDADSDGDGCADIEEAGDDPMLGGDRNPFFAYDFYDVPVPANRDPTPNGPRNKAIAMADVLAVLFYVGTYLNGPANANGVDYDSDKNGDTVKDGLDYDRSPSWPFSGPPDNAINLGDVLAALAQSGHNCVNPP